MAGIEHIPVEADEAGMRLDRWFKIHYPGLGFGQLQKLLRSGQVRVDGGRVKTDARVQPGQMVRVPPVVPVGFNGSYEILPKGRLLPKSGEIVIRIGAPIATDRYRAADKQALATDLHRAVQGLLDERHRA